MCRPSEAARLPALCPPVPRCCPRLPSSGSSAAQVLAGHKPSLLLRNKHITRNAARALCSGFWMDLKLFPHEAALGHRSAPQSWVLCPLPRRSPLRGHAPSDPSQGGCPALPHASAAVFKFTFYTTYFATTVLLGSGFSSSWEACGRGERGHSSALGWAFLLCDAAKNNFFLGNKCARRAFHPGSQAVLSRLPGAPLNLCIPHFTLPRGHQSPLPPPGCRPSRRRSPATGPPRYGEGLP